MAQIGREIQAAKRRRAMKRWLRAHGVSYRNRDMYNERALLKLVRENIEKVEKKA